MKNTFKVALQYPFNVLIVFKTVSYFKLILKLKVDPKKCTFKNLEEIRRTWKRFGKNDWQPCIQCCRKSKFIENHGIQQLWKKKPEKFGN